MTEIKHKYTKGQRLMFGDNWVEVMDKKVFDSNTMEWLYECENKQLKFQLMIRESQLKPAFHEE